MAWSNRKVGIGVALVALAVLVAAPAWGQTERKSDQWFSSAELDVMWMRGAARDLGERLEDARIRRDSGAITCTESRLEEIQEIVTRSEKNWMKVRESAAAQDYLQVEAGATEIKKDRAEVETLLKFVDECQQKIGKTGSFTEVTDEFNGLAGSDPTASVDTPGDPLPLPPEFEPPEEGTAGTPES